MRRSLLLAAFAASAATSLISRTALAQYPQVPHDIQQAADERTKMSDAHSDEMWAKALPRIEADAKAGKPYIPWAKKPEDLPQADIPAFPGAEGGGMHSFGGRGGKVYVVTSLEDDGPGTFREALEAAGPRIVVFNVSGIINLKHRIRVRAPYITINGASAPGDGVCIAGATVELENHDVVVRHLRFRRGQTDVGDRNDSFGGNPVGNVMVDHVSASWGLDENMSMYRHMYGGEFQSVGAGTRPSHIGAEKLPTVNITIQNSIFSEGLNTYHHAFGSTIGGLNSTFIRDLWACNTGRNPSVGMGGDFTLVNCVLFNWVHRTVDGGDDTSRYNIINNYFKPGPATPDNEVRHRLLKPESTRSKTIIDNFGKAYVNGNIVEGDEKVTKDNWDGGVQPAPVKVKVEDVLPKIRVDEPMPHAPMTIVDAKAAYEIVLANAGATLPKRDPVDQRVIKMVRTGEVHTTKDADLFDQLHKNKFSEERTKELLELVDKGIITDPKQVGGYPQYKGEPYADGDKDGMPDAWEKQYGLNPDDPADAAKDLNGDGYSNIEKFLNGLDPSKKIDWKDPKNNVDPRNTATPGTASAAR